MPPGCVCFGSGFGCTPPLLAGVLGCVWACVRAPLVPHHSWLGCAAWVLCLGSGLGCAPPLCSWVSGFVSACVRAPIAPRHSWLGCAVWVCVLGSGFGCAPLLLAGVLGCVCACVHAPLVPRHSWLGCAAWVCVLWLGFWLRPTTPGSVVGVCLCLWACSACTPPILGGVCGVRVGAWAGVAAAPATRGWGARVCVCLCARSAGTPPLLAGVCGVGVCARSRVSAAPRHSWLGCWRVCVLVCLFRLYPATPGWAVRRGCVCLGSGFGCAPPIPAGVCGVGVGAWAQVAAAPRHSWLRCWSVCVFGCALCLYPATLSWDVRCGGVCLGSGFGCTPLLLARVLGVFVSVGALRVYPSTPGWAVRCGCVCCGSGFGRAPPLLAGVLGCVCACVPVLLLPRDSWPGCSAWVCAFGLGFPLRPATPGRGVRCGRGCLGSGCSCAPRLVAGVSGCVCVCLRPLLVPRHSWLGCAVWVCVLELGFRLRPATPGRGVGCVCVCGRALRVPRHS